MEVPWKLVKNDIGGHPEKVIIINTVDKDALNKLLSAMPDIDSIVGIGGGMAIDAAKYFSWKRNIRLISIPTIVSVDAFLTPAAGVRSENKVIYIGNSSPDPLIIDYDIIRTAPKTLNIAGVGDLLSIHTASFDWYHAENNKKSEFPYSKENVIAGEKIMYRTPNFAEILDEGRLINLEGIVDGYVFLYKQSAQAWTFELDLRTSKEKW